MDEETQCASRERMINTLVASLQTLTPDSTVCTAVVLWQTEDLMVRVATSVHPEMTYEKEGVEMSNAAHMADLLEEAAKKLRALLA